MDLQRAQIATDTVVTYVRYILGFAAFFAVMSFVVITEAITDIGSSPSSLQFICSILLIAPCYVVAVGLVLRSRGYRRVELCYVIALALMAVKLLVG